MDQGGSLSPPNRRGVGLWGSPVPVDEASGLFEHPGVKPGGLGPHPSHGFDALDGQTEGDGVCPACPLPVTWVPSPPKRGGGGGSTDLVAPVGGEHQHAGWKDHFSAITGIFFSPKNSHPLSPLLSPVTSHPLNGGCQPWARGHHGRTTVAVGNVMGPPQVFVMMTGANGTKQCPMATMGGLW